MFFNVLFSQGIDWKSFNEQCVNKGTFSDTSHLHYFKMQVQSTLLHTVSFTNARPKSQNIIANVGQFVFSIVLPRYILKCTWLELKKCQRERERKRKEGEPDRGSAGGKENRPSTKKLFAQRNRAKKKKRERKTP